MIAAAPPKPADGELHHVFLVPGTMFCSTEPSIVTTVLGSCISVCFWDAASRVGGMNHYVLPHAPAGEISLRYGDVAIDALWHAMERLGAKRRRTRAKMFGGAAVLPFGNDGTIGDRNVRMAMEWLSENGIPLLAAHTGGHVGLQIRFNTGDGGVSVRQINQRAGRTG
jgi:chemotaxis protein CheD